MRGAVAPLAHVLARTAGSLAWRGGKKSVTSARSILDDSRALVESRAGQFVAIRGGGSMAIWQPSAEPITTRRIGWGGGHKRTAPKGGELAGLKGTEAHEASG